ncbi:MAG: AEC family transporter [Neisseriaceae bacterium]|nr:AEC family transporter [Neisseriaceae bacterium]
MGFLTTLSSVGIMGVMILIGILLRRNRPLSIETQGMLIQIIVNVALPCIILSSIFKFKMDGEMFKLVLLTFVGAAALNTVALLVCWALGKGLGYEGQRARQTSIISALGNTGFIGIPLCAILFGPKGALLAAVFDAGMDFVLWSLGIFMLQKDSKFSLASLKPMLNIPMLAIVLGLALGFMQFEAPQFLISLTTMLANVASPLAMIYIGLLVPGMWPKIRAMPKRQFTVPLLFKLFGVPALAMLMVSVLDLDLTLAQVILVQATMPTIALASIVFHKYGGDVDLAASTTIVSTLLALATIPIMVWLGTTLAL